MAQVTKGDRVYLKTEGLFGEVQRTNLFKLEHCPVVVRDDGVLVGYLGQKTTEVVNKATASDGVETVAVPVDVRVIGIQLLNAYGTSAEIQAQMFNKFVTLPKSVRDSYVAAFAAVDTSNQTELSAFLDNMIQQLTV